MVIIAKDRKEPIPLSDEEALAFMFNNNFTKSQYHEVRMNSLDHNSNIYPPYNKVRSAKTKCLPDNIEITEMSASVPLQDLLDHTVKRLIEVQEEVLTSQFEMSDELLVKGKYVYFP